MQFRFAGATIPMTLRVCRSLVWTQAMFVALAGLFVILAAVLFGDNNSIPFGGGNLTGSGAAALGGLYVAAGVGLAYLGVAVARLAAWARNAVVAVQVFLAVLLLARSFDLSFSTFLNLGLGAAIIALLFVPASSAALANGSRTAPTTAPVTALGGGDATAPGASRPA